MLLTENQYLPGTLLIIIVAGARVGSPAKRVRYWTIVYRTVTIFVDEIAMLIGTGINIRVIVITITGRGCISVAIIVCIDVTPGSGSAISQIRTIDRQIAVIVNAVGTILGLARIHICIVIMAIRPKRKSPLRQRAIRRVMEIRISVSVRISTLGADRVTGAIRVVAIDKSVAVIIYAVATETDFIR